MMSPRLRALNMPMPKSTVNFTPASPEAAFTPSFCWKRNTRKPAKPAFCRARRYSDSYMPKRHGPHEPAVKKTWLLMISSFVIPRACRPWRYCTRLPTVKYVGLQALEVLHQIANREVRGIALAVVAIFLAQLKRRDVGHRQNLAVISAALKHRLDHALVFPGQAAEKNGYLVAFFRGEGLLGRATKVMHGAAVEAHHAGQAGAFLGQFLLNLFFGLGLRTRQFIYREINASHRHQ